MPPIQNRFGRSFLTLTILLRKSLMNLLGLLTIHPTATGRTYACSDFKVVLRPNKSWNTIFRNKKRQKSGMKYYKISNYTYKKKTFHSAFTPLYIFFVYIALEKSLLKSNQRSVILITWHSNFIFLCDNESLDFVIIALIFVDGMAILCYFVTF